MVIVIGKSGQLSNELFDEKPSNINAVFLGRNDINFHDYDSVTKTLNLLNPSLIINASAYTDVDGAESDLKNAFFLNKDVPDQLSKYCSLKKIRLLHISSDYVFDGRKTSGYLITDKPSPLSAYGKSKLAGEESILGNMSENFSIVRTSWLYSSYGNNFVKTIVSLLRTKDEINVVNDQFGSPTYAKGLAQYLWSINEQKNINKIYHWSDGGKVSWYEFAKKIQELGVELNLFDNTTLISPISTMDYNFVAARPKFSTLLADNMVNIWQENLHTMLKSLKNE